jgi:hypothetical protein
MKRHAAYQTLPAKVVLRLLDKTCQSSFVACEAYREDPFRFRKPQAPHYKPGADGRSLLI